MQAIKCELCGSGDLIKKDGMFVCQHCGTKYTVEEARKLLGTVKIDKTDVKENNRTLARRAMQNRDYTEARRYYDILLSEEPNNWEPYFYSSICRALENDNPEDEERYVSLLNRTVPSTIQLIDQYVDDQDERHKALMVVLNSLNDFIKASIRLVTNYYRENRKEYEFPSGWLHNKAEAYGSIYDTYQDSVYHYFPGLQDVLDQVDVYYQSYVMDHKKAVSWKQRREIIKRMK